MQQSPSRLGTDFLFPKLHGIWARSFTGERLRLLTQAGSQEALRRALSPSGIDLAGRREFQRGLTAHFLAELASIKRFLGRRVAVFYDAVIERFFFADLKTVMHTYFFPERDVDVAFLLTDAPGLPRFDPDGIHRATSVHQLFEQIPPHPVRDRILPILVELDDEGDILQAECRLDSLFYERFRMAADGLPATLRACGRRLVGSEIDAANIVMVLRNSEVYHLPFEVLAGLILAGGIGVTPRHLEALSGSKARAEAIALLPNPYRDCLAPLVEGALHACEHGLDEYLYGLARACFNDYNRPGLSLVAFPFLKRVEWLNVGRVFEGLHFGLSAAEIQPMMIGGGHV